MTPFMYFKLEVNTNLKPQIFQILHPLQKQVHLEFKKNCFSFMFIFIFSHHIPESPLQVPADET